VAEFLKDQDELIINLEDAVSWVGKGTHNGCPARGVGGSYLLPDDCAHVIHSESLAELDDLGSDGDDFVATVIDGARELVTNVDAEPTSFVQHAKALFPNEIQIVDVALVGVVKTQLVLVSVVLELPVGWRSHDEVNGFIGKFRHLP